MAAGKGALLTLSLSGLASGTEHLLGASSAQLDTQVLCALDFSPGTLRKVMLCEWPA